MGPAQMAAAQGAVQPGTLDMSTIRIDQKVLALGTAPTRNRIWYAATVVKLKPFTVKYVATYPEASTLPLLLPTPREAICYASDLAPMPE